MSTRRRSTATVGVAAAAVVSLVALCACSAPEHAERADVARERAVGDADGHAPSGVKPVIRGLVDRQGEPPQDMLSVVHAYVVKVNWADLQPTPFGPIARDNAIDKAIARVRQPDYAAVGMALKLRVFAGIGAPEWVKSLGGTPIPYTNNQAGASIAGGTIGRFWTADFGKAYDDLQPKLAAKYDDVPEIRELTVSRCSTIFDELFVRQPGDVQNNAGAEGAGYTEAADKQCIEQAVQAHDVWKHTTSDVDFSPFPNVADPSQPRRPGVHRVGHDTCAATARRAVRAAEQRDVDRQAGQPDVHRDVRGDDGSWARRSSCRPRRSKRIGDEDRCSRPRSRSARTPSSCPRATRSGRCRCCRPRPRGWPPTPSLRVKPGPEGFRWHVVVGSLRRMPPVPEVPLAPSASRTPSASTGRRRPAVLHVMARMLPSGTELQLAGTLRAAQGRYWDPTLCVLYPGFPLATALRDDGVGWSSWTAAAGCTRAVRWHCGG